MLVIEAGDALIIDQNDSPVAGETGLLRRLVRRYPSAKTYLLALCSVDSDMLNFVDSTYTRVALPPEALKPGKVHDVSIGAARLGVGNFCCSSSQHLYIRKDSKWAGSALRRTAPISDDGGDVFILR